MRAWLLGGFLLLSACSGNYSDTSSVAGPTGGEPPQKAATVEDFFAANVSSSLNVCRTCHVSGASADSDKGRRFMLSSNSAEDYARMKAAWDVLGKGVETNRVLTKASNTDAEPHSAGALWPKDGIAYNNTKILFACWNDPAGCATLLSGGAGPGAALLPLLGSKRGGHFWDDYCEGRVDAKGQPLADGKRLEDKQGLPPDPRTLVKPGVSKDKAVHFNIAWNECQTGDTPKDCGAFRARQEHGYRLVAAAGQKGAATMFAGDASASSFAFSASSYNTMWQSVWRMSDRPANYDELVAQRWGMPLTVSDKQNSNCNGARKGKNCNPYPLPGEDPNKTDGGSGNLPMGLTQLRDAEGNWTSQISVTCSICHSGGVGKEGDGDGLGTIYGTNSLSDITVMFTDLVSIAPQQGALSVISQNKVRGTGNITNFQLFGTLTLFDDLPGYFTVQNQPSTGTEDPPVWWNLGHRVAKFFDGGMPADAKRIMLSFHYPSVAQPDNASGKKWITDNMQDGAAWITSQRSPAWPEAKLGKIDTALAEQGAILFHNKNLWAPQLNNPVAKPTGGNGSCASCHGAYSPRYVNDPAYLDSPLLEGIAANVVPIEIIGTDTRRLDGNSQTIAQYSRKNWFAYSDVPEAEKNEKGVPFCGNQNDTDLRGDRKLGYLAPPLYGVWATAPYFHNGSVPNILEVLKPSERKTIWRRKSVSAPTGQAGQVVMGYDYSLESGYDKDKMGWNYDELACGTGSYPLIDCNPLDQSSLTVQDGLGLMWANGGLAWNMLNPPIMTNQQLEDRKIYNTKYYSQSNAGHQFTSVLTEQELKALMEYLKTL